MTSATSTETYPALSDRFSWRRVWLFGSLYKNEIRIAAFIYGALMISTYMLSTWALSFENYGLVLLLMTLAGWGVFLVPLLFGFVPANTSALLPVSPREKWTFLCIFTFIVSPLAINVFWYVPAHVCHWLWGWPTYDYMSRELVIVMAKADINVEQNPLTLAANLMQMECYFSGALLGVFMAKRHPIGGGFVGLGIVLAILMTASAVGGVAMAMSDKEALLSGSADTIVKSMTPLVEAIGVLAAVITAVCVVWLYRVLKRRNYE